LILLQPQQGLIEFHVIIPEVIECVLAVKDYVEKGSREDWFYDYTLVDSLPNQFAYELISSMYIWD
jgi:hypothetical protein